LVPPASDFGHSKGPALVVHSSGMDEGRGGASARHMCILSRRGRRLPLGLFFVQKDLLLRRDLLLGRPFVFLVLETCVPRLLPGFSF